MTVFIRDTFEASLAVGCSEWLMSTQPFTWKTSLPDLSWAAKASACHCRPANHRWEKPSEIKALMMLKP